MTDESTAGGPAPLPPQWLPARHPAPGAPEWEAEIARIVAAADPELHRLRKRGEAGRASSWLPLDRWWAPAAALAAAAAAAVLFIGERSARPPAPAPGSLSLALVAAQGAPVSFWRALGVEADPVLAWIAFQSRAPAAGQPDPRARPAEVKR